MNSEPIDFIIPWVDGNDPAWQAARAKVKGEAYSFDCRARYREWDLLRYLFRGIEKNTPWVRKIHFITWGHLPKWLNTQNEKLHIVIQDELVPKKYTPTFNINAIELNLHRIEGLSEQFVYFNDDMFLLKPLRPEYFFRNGLPCDFAVMNPIYTLDLAEGDRGSKIFYMPFNCVQHLNAKYSERECLKKNWRKWFTPVYGKYLLRNFCLLPWPRFVGFMDNHLTRSFLKSSFEEAWETDYETLDETCRRKARSDYNVFIFYIRYRQLAEGKFSPVKPYDPRAYLYLKDKNQEALTTIRERKYPVICLNEMIRDEDPLKDEDIFKRAKGEINTAFQTILPERSSFELENA